MQHFLYARIKKLVETVDDVVSLQQAKDPSTKPELLNKLKSHPDSNIRDAVANNPNTHLDDLLDLAKEGHSIEHNDAMFLHYLENPNLTSKFKHKDAVKTAAFSHANPTLIRHLYKNYYPENNPESRQTLLKFAVRFSKDPVLLHDAVDNQEVPAHLHQEIAENPAAHGDTLEKLKDRYPYHVASNPNTHLSTLHHIIDKNSLDERLMNSLLKNNKIPSEILHTVFDKNHKAGYFFVRSPMADESLLLKILKSNLTPDVISQARTKLLKLSKESK